MSLEALFGSEKWRRTGTINIVLMVLCGTILFVCLMVSLSYHRGSIQELDISTIIFDGPCDKASRINVILHLLINLLSTAILASSNFFMQVLSSPSRPEIDKAHANLCSLDIGIPSVKNMQHLSTFKLTSWLVLLFSSVPIHLFFNGSIFITNYQSDYWNLVIATEAFTEGAAYFPPGASLAQAGTSNFMGFYHVNRTYNRRNTTYTDEAKYGTFVELGAYSNHSSSVYRNLTSAATNAKSWDILSPKDCRAEYKSCTPRTKYRDVIIVVKADTEDARGWTRLETFDFSTAANVSSKWDQLVPPRERNSLWFSAPCSVTTTILDHCTHTCQEALGFRYSDTEKSVEDETPSEEEEWKIQFEDPALFQSYHRGIYFGENGKFNQLEVQYCRAQPLPAHCKVGCSNTLLLTVIVCVTIKVIQCTIVVLVLPHTSLVTPGDAMESLITQPDLKTLGLSTLNVFDSERLGTTARRPWTLARDDLQFAPALKPRRWQSAVRRLKATIPRVAWARTYFLLSCSLLGLALLLIPSYLGNEYSL